MPRMARVFLLALVLVPSPFALQVLVARLHPSQPLFVDLPFNLLSLPLAVALVIAFLATRPLQLARRSDVLPNFGPRVGLGSGSWRL